MNVLKWSDKMSGFTLTGIHEYCINTTGIAGK